MACTILPWVCNGKSQISSKKSVPLLACSNKPILDWLISLRLTFSFQPNNTCSTLSGDNVAHEARINGYEFLIEFL